MEADFQTFANNKELIANIESNLDYLNDQFNVLKDLTKITVSDESFNQAITAFYKVFELIPLLAPHINSYEMPFFRARHNKIKNKLYKNIGDISYNKERPDLIEAGRFNQPKQAVFYASLPFENIPINPSLTACLETCKGLTDQNHPVQLTDFTISRWKIKSPFYVINFCFDEDHLKANAELKLQTDEYLNNIKACLNKYASDFVLEFLTYFSEMSGNRTPTKNEYYILTAMFYAMRYYYKEKLKKDIHGLIYPSAMTETNGLNIVLTTTAVDKFLKPDKVAMYRFFLDGKTYHAAPCSNAVDILNDEFNITGFRRIPENRWYTVECEAENGGPLKESRD
ncbi:hypothetical protein EZ456_22860 [Pedobacter psychrodurus]|uniref:RES domain-containing protein n=1 Tax=Pedobacter psychrodurus TaxID=2530456 RepID=A0A4R0PIY1_9SPHI|nr:hypothetical protein [Pedobacter psychrodurus]TCD17460.1 hypothetical protein EZ456_22860 [Pedobacter psychrodurus]